MYETDNHETQIKTILDFCLGGARVLQGPKHNGKTAATEICDVLWWLGSSAILFYAKQKSTVRPGCEESDWRKCLRGNIKQSIGFLRVRARVSSLKANLLTSNTRIKGDEPSIDWSEIKNLAIVCVVDCTVERIQNIKAEFADFPEVKAAACVTSSFLKRLSELGGTAIDLVHELDRISSLRTPVELFKYQYATNRQFAPLNTDSLSTQCGTATGRVCTPNHLRQVEGSLVPWIYQFGPARAGLPRIGRQLQMRLIRSARPESPGVYGSPETVRKETEFLADLRGEDLDAIYSVIEHHENKFFADRVGRHVVAQISNYTFIYIIDVQRCPTHKRLQQLMGVLTLQGKNVVMITTLSPIPEHASDRLDVVVSKFNVDELLSTM